MIIHVEYQYKCNVLLIISFYNESFFFFLTLLMLWFIYVYVHYIALIYYHCYQPLGALYHRHSVLTIQLSHLNSYFLKYFV